VFLAGNLAVAILVVPVACIHKLSAVLYTVKGSFVVQYPSALLFNCEKYIMSFVPFEISFSLSGFPYYIVLQNASINVIVKNRSIAASFL
jgi:hypothetical protein